MKQLALAFLGLFAAAFPLSAQPALTWTKRTTNHSAEYTMTAATSVTDKFAVIGYRTLSPGNFESRLSTSSDGITWSTPALLPTPGIVRAMVSASGTLYATVEDNNAANTNHILSSNDGIAWSTRNTGVGNLVSLASAGSGRPIVAVGAANGGSNVALSNDGGTGWTRVNTGRVVDLHKVVFANNQFLAMSRSGTLLSSLNGTTWASVTVAGLPAGATFAALATWDRTFLLLVNDSTQRPRLFVSTDAATWTAAGTTLDAALFNGVLASNGDFVTLGGSTTASGPGVVYTATQSRGDLPTIGAWPASAQTVDSVGPGLNFLTFIGGLWITGSANGAVYTAGARYGSPGAEPVITAHPVSQTAPLGGSATFSVAAVGSGSGLTYQWFRGGLTPIPGATNSSLTITNITNADFATYLVQIGYPGSFLFANPATLTAGPANLPATITTQPVSQSVPLGGFFNLFVSASSQSAATYQWFLNGSRIPGATDVNFNVLSATAAHAGAYTVVVTNAAGAVTSNVATLTVTPGPCLTNLSIRSTAGSDSRTLIVGVTLGGSGTIGSKNLLIRGVGPSLAAFGVTGALADPKLEIFSNGAVIASNDNWDAATTPVATQTAVGAFALTPGTKDAALLHPNAAAGGYSVQVTGVNGTTGVALAEIYDLTPGASFTLTTSRLTNLSARTQVGTNGDILITGFSLVGEGRRRLLIRAVGPALGAFGVADALVDPVLQIYSGSRLIATVDNWTESAAPLATQTAAGAFALTPGSKDAAVVLTFEAGSYTAQVTGANDTTGVALVEIYELP